MANPGLSPRAHRPVVMGTNGMVASAHPLASLAGLRVLMEGGNAFDATVAVASTLNVVEPYMSGVGGIGALLAYVAKEKRVRALNFTGRAPRKAEPSAFTAENIEHGIRPVLVPGNVAGWLTLHGQYGTMSLERLLASAIAYASEGFPLTHLNSRIIARYRSRLEPFATSAAIMLSGGQAPGPGTVLRQPQLAETLRRIAKGGIQEFYRGETARRIARASQELGGLLTAEDLADYQPQWQEPVRITYRGYEVVSTPPNCSSFQVLATLNIMEGFSGPDLVYCTPDTLHLTMEAAKLCVADRIKYSGDPDHVTIPIQGILSKEYAAQQRKRIDRTSATPVSGERISRQVPAGALAPGAPERFASNMTTHFAVADRDGNVVSVTQTLGNAFGSGIAAGDTGVFLNNMAYWFEIAPELNSPNLIGPWKRVDFVVAPTQVFRDGRFHLSVSSPGSYGILQTTLQMVMNVLDFGMSIQEAIEAPRFRYYEGTRVQMEERFPPEVRRALEDRGHHVEVIEAWSMLVGGAHGIVFDARQGAFHGGADPRRDGYALGW